MHGQNESLFSVKIRPHPRAKSLRLRVHPDGRVTLTTPKRCSRAFAERFLEHNQAWIKEVLAEIPERPIQKSGQELRKQYLQHKEAARRRVYAFIARLAPIYGVAVRAVAIRNQKSRWGSCSRNGVLSFNYRIALMREPLAEYIVAHELSHLIEFNHSPRFWAHVEKVSPNYRELRKELHAIDPVL